MALNQEQSPSKCGALQLHSSLTHQAGSDDEESVNNEESTGLWRRWVISSHLYFSKQFPEAEQRMIREWVSWCFLGHLNDSSLISMKQNVQFSSCMVIFLLILLILTSVMVNSMWRNNNYISLMNNVLMNNVLHIIYDLRNFVPSDDFSEIGDFVRAECRVPIFTLRGKD